MGDIMRMGFVVYGGLERVTGGTVYDRMLVEHFRSRGHEVDVVALPGNGSLWSVRDNFSSKLFGKFVSAPYDVLLQDELCHPSLFIINGHLKETVSYPVISIVHLLQCLAPGREWERRVRRGIEIRYLRTIDGFVATSRETARCLEELTGREQPKAVIYPGKDRLPYTIDRDGIVERTERLKTFNILFSGNVSRAKGLHVLVRALSSVRDRRWHLYVAGSQDVDLRYVQSIKREIEHFGMSGRVSFLDLLSKEVLGRMLAQTHLCAIPSLYESFGISGVEAMGAGVPVIASSAGGAREAVRHGKEGFLVRPGDDLTLALHLRRLMEDRKQLLSMSFAALARYERMPGWSETASAVLRFIEGRVRSTPADSRPAVAASRI